MDISQSDVASERVKTLIPCYILNLSLFATNCMRTNAIPLPWSRSSNIVNYCTKVFI
jgi:hypothetical protein